MRAENSQKFSMKIARICVGFWKFWARDTCAAGALRSEKCCMYAAGDVQRQCSVWMRFWMVCAHFRHRIAPVSGETRAILREIRRDFGAQDACIVRKKQPIIAGSRCACTVIHLKQRYECVVRCARKIRKFFDENRTNLRWFFEVLGARHVRCGRAALGEVLHLCCR